MRQKLQGIVHEYFPDKAAAPDLVPVICLTQPEIITWNFPCNRWFATDEDDHQISRMLYPDPGGRCQ